jgi:hypothetical protein
MATSESLFNYYFPVYNSFDHRHSKMITQQVNPDF